MVMKLRYRNKECEVMLGPNKFWIWTTSKNFAQISHKLCKIRWKDVFFSRLEIIHLLTVLRKPLSDVKHGIWIDVSYTSGTCLADL